MIWFASVIVIVIIFTLFWHYRINSSPNLNDLSVLRSGSSSLTIEKFTNQTRVPPSQPDTLSWKFQSPKSDLQTFNETTILHQNLNQLQPHNSGLIDHYQPLPLWVYPFTYINRHFDQIITTLAHQMEKDFNQGLRLSQRPNQEWRHPLELIHTTIKWNQLPSLLQSCVSDVITELNRRFNLAVPIVSFRRQGIRYIWIDAHQALVVVKIFKRYAFEDIKYYEGTSPNLNERLKFDFERDLLMYFDQVKQDGSYHLKYLRFPSLNYEHDDIYDDMIYVGEYDHRFYLPLSRDPNYRMLDNTEARELYITHLLKQREQNQYSCFTTKFNPSQAILTDPLQGQQRTPIMDQNACETKGNLWVKRCQKDTDCPYYQSNQYYQNNFGHCQTESGYCQMPIGVQPLTYREPSNPQDAVCYNCPNGFAGPGTAGQCCQKQKHPDYMFLNDLQQRFQNRDEFERRGLNWSQLGGRRDDET